MKCPYCRNGYVMNYSDGSGFSDKCNVCDGKAVLSDSSIPYLASIASSLSIIAKNIDAMVDKKGNYIWVRKAWG